MRGLLSLPWVLFVMFLSGPKSTESKTLVDLTGTPALPEGYSIYSDGNVAYKIHKDLVTWYEARAQCVLDGGDLAIADTVDKIRHIKSMDSSMDYWLHIGIHKRPGTQRWKTVGNVELSTPSIPWAWSEPDQTFDNGDCAAIVVSEVGISECECTRKAQSVCEIPIRKNSVGTGSVHGVEAGGTTQYSLQPPLPQGYSVRSGDNVAYKIYNVFVKWDDARARCIFDGGDLAIADTRDKIQHIQSLDSDVDNWLFVGIHKPVGSDNWRTVDDVELSTSSIPWMSTVSDRTLNADNCAAIVLVDVGLAPYECTQKALFVCEIPKSKYLIAVKDVITTTTTVAPETSVNSKLPDGYIKFSQFNTAYKIYEEYSMHHEARNRCFSDRGRLAVPDSFEKINVIAAMRRSGPVHVGIRISSSNFEKWVVDSDGELLKDLPWTPDNPHPMKCAAMREDGSGLEDTLCSNKLQFLCEIRQTDLTKKSENKKN